MNKFKNFIIKHRKLSTIIILTFFIFIGCCTFPIYNLNYELPIILVISNVIIAMMLYNLLGSFESGIFKRNSTMLVLFVNTLLVVSSMGCRYLMEYGEVSNTYNFTLPNIALHIVATVGMSVVSWSLNVNKKK